MSLDLEAKLPHVFTLQLVWDSHSQEPDAIAGTMRAVGEEVGSTWCQRCLFAFMDSLPAVPPSLCWS